MRWILAGLSFALLVGLAVATTAIRANNVALRGRLQVLEQRILSYSAESRSSAHVLAEVTTRPHLARLWRRFMARASAE
ncbi:MAG: hypothetical protein AAF628_09550 [Planctomycetota bacterium]